MSDTLPEDLAAYRRTPIFDQDSLPAGLRLRHSTKEGVWGLIVVLEGRLRYRLLDPPSERILDPQTSGVVQPAQPHEVEPLGPVRFYVEFYSDGAPAGSKTASAIPLELSSPACSADQADDSYMGYASTSELVTFLNELLEAERAGARVTLETARTARSPAIAELMRNIQHDEVRWCAMLLRRIKTLEGAASPRMGAFYDKAMAIDDLSTRIGFVNRGQGWVVRKLREMLPRVRDAELHADLTDMLTSHVANIALTNSADLSAA
jgi:tellurite resistance-related uncharacterized protein